MDANNLPTFLRTIADDELARLKAKLPDSVEARFVVFLEIQRVFDVWYVQETSASADPSNRPKLDILRWGMNSATAYLLSAPLTTPGIPLAKSSSRHRAMATDVLWSFGAIALVKKAAAMLEHGFIKVEINGDSLTFKDSGTGPVQYMDHIQWDELHRAEKTWKNSPVSSHDWTILDKIREEDANAPGAFWSLDTPPVRKHLLSFEKLTELMLPLIKPWRIPQGTLMGYEARPDVDDHFIEAALYEINELIADAGIHPEVQFKKFTGEELLEVATLLLSFARKHVIFGLIAHKHIPEIDASESFTIWEPKEKLVDSICAFTGKARDKVRQILAALTLSPSDMTRLSCDATPLLPMLIDLGNGTILRPVSGLFRNPLDGFKTLGQWRDATTRNTIANSREAWFRREIYGIFGGARYTCIPGNIVLRTDGKTVTDIDAVVFDRTNGELALFQLKWQDYSTSDVRQLRSKTSNLAAEVDLWAQSVQEWIQQRPPQALAQALRLKMAGPQMITSVFLFAVSKSVARTHGYGFPVQSPYLCIASWPQFKRIRVDVGPAPRVISKMHELVHKEEQLALTATTPRPVTVDLAGLSMHFANLWCSIDEPEDQAQTNENLPRFSPD